MILSYAGCRNTDEASRHYDIKGGFSYVPPEGWETFQPPEGLILHVFYGKRVGDFTPSITVTYEKYPGSLESMVDYYIETMRGLLNGFNFLERVQFVTGDKLRGIKLAVDVMPDQRFERQYLYFFEGDVKKYTVICSALPENAEVFEPLYDATVKTFKIE